MALQLIRHITTGERYLAELDERGNIIQVSVALHYSDVDAWRAGDLTDDQIDVQPDDAEELNPVTVLAS